MGSRKRMGNSKTGQTVLRFGLLGVALVLLLAVSEYALFLQANARSWTLAGAAALLVGAGLWLGRLLFARRSAPPVPDPAEVEDRIATFEITPREYEVLSLVARGLSNREIADRLYIAESTVKTHVSNLLAKLNATRRTQAVSIARREGLLP